MPDEYGGNGNGYNALSIIGSLKKEQKELYERAKCLPVEIRIGDSSLFSSEGRKDPSVTVDIPALGIHSEHHIPNVTREQLGQMVGKDLQRLTEEGFQQLVTTL